MDNKDFFEFLDNTPTAYNCVDNLKKDLLKKGYTELYEEDEWSYLDDYGKYFTTRGDSSLIAFQMPNNSLYQRTGSNIISTHADSPTFSIKLNGDIFKSVLGDNAGYLKLNVEGYGAMINYSFLDRPLSIAGRVFYEDVNKGELSSKIINIDKDLLIIPSQAIHVNRDVNNANKLNHQVDMQPIMGVSKNICFSDIIKDNVDSIDNNSIKMYDYDLYLYNRDKAKYVGYCDDMIMSPRLDDLACLYPAYQGFLDSVNEGSINVFCAFNNEEIGSLTKQGADSSFLIDVLARISKVKNLDLRTSLANSFMVSADNAHAVHPNAIEKSDSSNQVLMNQGIVIKHHTNYTTDSLSSGIFKKICNNAQVPYQDFSCRSDMICGWTLGGVSGRHVSIDSVDIGLAQLAMHSANEVMGAKDPNYLYQVAGEFYQSRIVREYGKVKVLKMK